jgi:hypothetical protein
MPAAAMPLPVILVVAAIAAAQLVVVVRNKLRRRQPDAPWGRPIQRIRDEGVIGRLYRIRGGGDVTDRTWRDLSMWNVFERIDRCASPMGQQALYARMRSQGA